jgi:outer membrane lipoprotein LolB
LTSPLGSILGIMRWSPTEAVLEQNGSIKRFASTDELLAQTTGAAVPVSALFDWLGGKNTPTPGWTADLSQQSNGRITAQRTNPLPSANLRIVLDKP